MLHLSFYLCIIVCLRAHYNCYTNSPIYMPRDELTPLGGDYRSSYKHSNHSRFKLYCRDFFLSEPQQHSSVDGISPPQKRQRAKVHCRDFPSRRLHSIAGAKICRCCCGTDTTWEPPTEPFQIKQHSKYLGVKAILQTDI